MPKKILIAEDEEDIASQYKMMLEERGHKVVIVKDGLEAINAYEEAYHKRESSFDRPFDVVVLDYSMPHKDGASLAQEIRELVPDQRIIFVTGHGNKLITRLADFEEEDGVDLLTKPTSLKRMIGIIEEY